MLIIAIAFFKSPSAIVYPVIVLSFSVINIIAVYSWWAELGVAHQWIPRSINILLAFACIAAMTLAILYPVRLAVRKIGTNR